MQNAETVLGVIQNYGKQGKPLERIYRLLYNPELYLRAYARMYSNKGAMTPGTTGETVDGMSLAKIEAIIEDIRHERYRWTPAKRVYIPKKNGKQRPLGIPTWSDKLLQEVMRQVLEAYYEPQFSDLSHGFRPNRGCHTALSYVQFNGKGTWKIGDGTQRTAGRRKEASSVQSFQISTSISSTSMSKRYSFQNTPKGENEEGTPSTGIWNTNAE